ncbi:MAG: hypothetical protein AAF518_26265 [Spirochaetota bacterium]
MTVEKVKLTNREINFLLDHITQKIFTLEETAQENENTWPEDFDANDITVYRILEKDYNDYLSKGLFPNTKWKGNAFLLEDIKSILSREYKPSNNHEKLVLLKIINFLSS